MDRNKAGTNGRQAQSKASINLKVSADKMAAFITVTPDADNKSISSDEIIAFLKENSIVFGLCSGSIEDFCANKKFNIELLCARGMPPVDQEDAHMEYMFKTSHSALPTEREDGTVDFRNLGIVQNVSKGDVLCRIITAPEGKDGKDVYGAPVKYKNGRIPNFPTGSNTIISDDKLTLSAAIDGCIDYKKDILNINDTFTVRGDVDSASGNIDFLGTVIVQGDVLEGFSVKAGRDIIVRGMVEGAMLDAGESIMISNGMNGMGKGLLKAKENVTGKYFENTRIECGGNINADVIMNCIVHSGNAIILKGRHALLVGGKSVAGKCIYANTIGSNSNVKTDISIQSDVLKQFSDRSEEQLEELKRDLTEATNDANALDKQLIKAKSILPVSKGNPKILLLIKSIIKNKADADARIKTIKKQIEQLDKPADNNDYSYLNFNVIGNRIIYRGTKITIGPIAESLADDYSNTKFYMEKGHIIPGQILPSDKISY
jgi:hypothetical protein